MYNTECYKFGISHSIASIKMKNGELTLNSLPVQGVFTVGTGIMQHQSINMQEILGVSGGKRQVVTQGDRSNLRVFGGD